MARFEGCDQNRSPGAWRGCLQCVAGCVSEQQVSVCGVPAASRAMSREFVQPALAGLTPFWQKHIVSPCCSELPAPRPWSHLAARQQGKTSLLLGLETVLCNFVGGQALGLQPAGGLSKVCHGSYTISLHAHQPAKSSGPGHAAQSALLQQHERILRFGLRCDS